MTASFNVLINLLDSKVLSLGNVYPELLTTSISELKSNNNRRKTLQNYLVSGNLEGFTFLQAETPQQINDKYTVTGVQNFLCGLIL
jgi:hypothetical protein